MPFHKTVFCRAAIAATVAVAVHAGAAFAGGPGIRPCDVTANYCHAGLEPVPVDGVIGCGTPNRAQSYQQARRHSCTPARRARARYGECSPGVKGCD